MKRTASFFLLFSLVVVAVVAQSSIRIGLEFSSTRVVEHTFFDESSQQNQAVYFANGELITSSPNCECEATSENGIRIRLTNWWYLSHLPVNRVADYAGMTQPEVIIEIDQFLVKSADLIGGEEHLKMRINHINARLSTFNFERVNGIQAAIKVELPFNRDVHFRVVCARTPQLSQL